MKIVFFIYYNNNIIVSQVFYDTFVYNLCHGSTKRIKSRK